MSCVLRKAIVCFADYVTIVAYKMQVVREIACLLCLYGRRTSYGANLNFGAEKPALNRTILEASTWLL